MTQDTLDKTMKIRTSGSGFDLVLIHGWGMNSGAFDNWLPLLESEYRITLIDLPGFGVNKDVKSEPYDVKQIAELVKPAIPVGAVVAGWSLGGLVAQQLAIQEPELLSGLITIASSPCFIQRAGWSGIRPEILATFAGQLTKSYDKTLERFLAIQAMGSNSPRAQVKQLQVSIKAYPDPCESALKNGLGILEHADIRNAIGKISIPTLRLYGKRDSLVPVSAVDAIHNLHPQSDNVILSDAAHAPFISHPEATAQIFNQFISGLPQHARLLAKAQ